MTSSSRSTTLPGSVQTRPVCRLATGALLLILLAPCVAVAQKRAWQLSFTPVTDTFILKEPVWTRLTLTNVSGTALPKVGFWGHFYLDGQQQACFSDLAPVDEPVPPPRPRGPKVATPVPPQRVEPGWKRSIMVNLGDVCNPVRRGEKVLGKHTVCYRDDERSDLVNLPVCVSFAILPPEGVDRQVYEAFGHEPLAHGDIYRELLRRFPTSTYAAYIVRDHTQPGTQPPDSDVALYAMESGSMAFGPTPLPCVNPESPECRDIGFPPTGLEGARRQAAWLDLVLRSHPDIWFADELRFKRAYAAYFLGDDKGCAARLESLANHGKPYVASKAKELLAAMRAKGMLDPHPPVR